MPIIDLTKEQFQPKNFLFLYFACCDEKFNMEIWCRRKITWFPSRIFQKHFLQQKLLLFYLMQTYLSQHIFRVYCVRCYYCRIVNKYAHQVIQSKILKILFLQAALLRIMKKNCSKLILFIYRISFYWLIDTHIKIGATVNTFIIK